ncbi:O-antigen ligase like membrane protein [Roseovarius mucosus DSM 17069]|uniref:O-antigen ligase like membrane protein n=1 Tax=Roseovarius mucosus DSM 17069 TaxID=1288298 RepID=A0A0A0HQ13_9RHOB|nr:membrane protein [Roseovarius mucosus]KGM88168.1 O-antigen ligase like membrane protein [Roseovarius mucosus DSM 17069]
MPNALAYLMLAAWPLITLVMFRRWPMERALIWSLLGAYMFLPPPPAAFDFPLMPPLTKESLPSLATFVICLIHAKARAPLLPQTLPARVLVALFILSPVATVLTNGEPVFYGRIGLPALGLKDMVALCLLQAILLLPFLLARQHLATPEGLRELVKALMLGGLIYSLPMLLEVRLSPQLNIWIYGYFQHSFEQMMRAGGFRPIVFMYHGLWVAFFTVMAMTCAIALAREADVRRRIFYLLAALYLGGVLVLCKSLGSLIYGVYLAPLALFLPTRMQIHIAGVIAVVAIAYPVLKGAGLIPVDWILEQAAKVDPERANSLRFRLDNEDILMERALEKPLFGWGSWGRNHILNPITGVIETVTDGRWIILIGIFGWVGYLAEFGLIALPVLMLWVYGRRLGDAAHMRLIGPVALLLAVNLIDMLPNATLTPLTWLFAGAVLGLAETARHQRPVTARRRPLGWRPIM